MKKHILTIICEDIRNELGNKNSLMGVFSNGIYLPEIPTVLRRFSIYQQWEGLGPGDCLKLSVTGPGIKIPDALIDISPQPSRNLLRQPGDRDVADIALSLGNLQIRSAGDFEISTTLQSSEGNQIVKYNFFIRQIPKNL